MAKTLNADQATRSKRRFIRPVQMLVLKAYSDREAGTVATNGTFYFATEFFKYDYDNSGTLRVFEPVLDGLSTLTKSMDHLLDFEPQHPQMDIVLRNIPYRDQDYLSRVLTTFNIENAQIELSEILLDYNETVADLQNYVGNEHTVQFKGVVRSVDATDQNSIQMVADDIAVRFDKRTLWYGHYPAQNPTTGENPQKRDKTIKWPVVFGSPETWRGRIFQYPSVGVMAIAIDNDDTGAKAFDGDAGNWSVSNDVMMNQEVIDISAITNTSVTINARNQAGSVGGAVAHTSGVEVMEAHILQIIAAHHAIDVLNASSLGNINAVSGNLQVVPATATVSTTVDGEAAATMSMTATELRNEYVETGGGKWNHDAWWIRGRRAGDTLATGAECPTGDTTYTVSAGTALAKVCDVIRYMVQERMNTLSGDQFTAAVDETNWATAEGQDSSSIHVDARWLGDTVTEVCKRLAGESYGNFVWAEGEGRLLLPTYTSSQNNPQEASISSGAKNTGKGTTDEMDGTGRGEVVPNTSANHIYVTDFDDERVRVISTTSNTVVDDYDLIVHAGNWRPQCMVLSGNKTYLWVGKSRGTFDPGGWEVFNTSTGNRVSSGETTCPQGVGVDPGGVYCYAACEDTIGRSEIKKLTISSGVGLWSLRNLSNFNTGGADTYFKDAAATYDKVFVSDCGDDNRVVRFTQAGAYERVDAVGYSFPQYLVADQRSDHKRLFISCRDSNKLVIWEVSGSGAPTELAAIDVGSTPGQPWFDQANERLYVPSSAGTDIIDTRDGSSTQYTVLDQVSGSAGDGCAIHGTGTNSLPRLYAWKGSDGTVDVREMGTTPFSGNWGTASTTFNEDNILGTIVGDRKETADLLTKIRVLYRFDPSMRGGTTTGDPNAYKEFEDVDDTASEGSFGELRPDQEFLLLSSADDTHALTFAHFLLTELSAQKWVFNFIADWVGGYDVELGDIINVHPPYLSAAVKCRILLIEKNFDDQTYRIKAVEVD